MRYLSEHRREVEDYMFALLRDEELKEAYGDYRESIGEEKGLQKGISQGIKQGTDKAMLNAIQSLVKNKGFTIDEAMEALEIPNDKRAVYKASLE